MSRLRAQTCPAVARWTRDFLRQYSRYSTQILRGSVGVIFIWFGAFKLFPGGSPAEDIATRCMDIISFGLVPADLSRPLLALLEIGIGLGLVTGILLRVTLALFFVHMGGVLSALVLVPDAVWSADIPMGATLEGQYIIKNVVLIAACLTVATTHGGRSGVPGSPAVSEAPVPVGEVAREPARERQSVG